MNDREEARPQVLRGSLSDLPTNQPLRTLPKKREKKLARTFLSGLRSANSEGTSNLERKFSLRLSLRTHVFCTTSYASLSLCAGARTNYFCPLFPSGWWRTKSRALLATHSNCKAKTKRLHRRRKRTSHPQRAVKPPLSALVKLRRQRGDQLSELLFVILVVGLELPKYRPRFLEGDLVKSPCDCP